MDDTNNKNDQRIVWKQANCEYVCNIVAYEHECMEFRRKSLTHTQFGKEEDA